MMYMDDAIRATVELMEAERPADISIRIIVGALSFSPDELADAIKKYIFLILTDFVRSPILDRRYRRYMARER